MTYHYTLFGLNTSSSHKLAHFPESTFKGTPDLFIKRGKIEWPESNMPNTIYKPFSVLNKDLYFHEIPSIARFQLIGKSKLTIQKLPQAKWQDVHAFLFDTVLTMLLMKNNIFLFHGTTVSIGKMAYMFCGPGGLGKSTLAAYLIKNKAAKIIEDDKCYLEYVPSKNKFQIKNHYPFMELWSSNANLLKDIDDIKKIGKIRENIQKIQFSIKDHVPKKRKSLTKIVLFQMTNNDEDMYIKELKGIGKVNAVKNHIHFDRLVPVFGKNPDLFRMISNIVNGISVYFISKSRTTKLDEFISFIEKEIVD